MGRATSPGATAPGTIRRPAKSPCSATTTTTSSRGARQRASPSSIVVSYANEGERTHIDELKKVKITKRSNKASQGDKSLTVDLDLMIVGGIVQDGVEPI